ncbi:hypothetical protein KsCSTR_26400 [Candidatus Kuenenia stuttgartiensis]|uniref:Uncharacterized protein n=1 Tax=Kuenenia stuttgartiensis TaxID=174633 RepID=Q1Q788_KUEST|nr:hypothetical protein KsCSTR_26400 [Candidatus Kuenenia stuttgartiensis]CAJ73444.1 unknown protein [Candidatus Kuenenia stuttgartiensis]
MVISQLQTADCRRDNKHLFTRSSLGAKVLMFKTRVVFIGILYFGICSVLRAS